MARAHHSTLGAVEPDETALARSKTCHADHVHQASSDLHGSAGRSVREDRNGVVDLSVLRADPNGLWDRRSGHQVRNGVAAGRNVRRIHRGHQNWRGAVGRIDPEAPSDHQTSGGGVVPNLRKTLHDLQMAGGVLDRSGHQSWNGVADRNDPEGLSDHQIWGDVEDQSPQKNRHFQRQAGVSETGGSEVRSGVAARNACGGFQALAQSARPHAPQAGGRSVPGLQAGHWLCGKAEAGAWWSVDGAQALPRHPCPSGRTWRGAFHHPRAWPCLWCQLR